MNASAQGPRPLFRLLSVAAVGCLAAAGLSLPTAATAATQTVTIDATAFNRYVSVYRFDEQTISRGSTTVTVTLPEVVDSVAYDGESADLDGTTVSLSRQGASATLTVPSSFWTSHRVNSTFDLTLTGSDEAEDDADITDAYDASFSVKVGAVGGGATTLSSDDALLDVQTAYQPSTAPVSVEAGDTLVLESDAGFFTEGPSSAAALVDIQSTEESVEISDDGSTASVVVGPPSRFREAVSPSGFADLSVVASSDYIEDVTETVWVTFPISFPKPTPVIDRVAGTDRYTGAAAISAAAYPDGSDVVYIAAGTAFPDALSAAPAAAHEGAPLLLTLPGRLPASIETEIARLEPDRIVVIGGTAAVSSTVFDQLETMAPRVDRIAGANRFEVSRAVADYAFGTDGSQVAFFATGVAFPDALSASSAAGAFGAPVILVRGNAAKLDDATFDTIESLGVELPLIAGGTVSVSEGIEADLDSIANDDFGGSLRLSGSNRYLTSLAIARFAFDATDQVFIASGANFPDALAGAAWAGSVGGPLYIAPTSCVPDGMVADIDRYAESRITILGGTKSLTPAVESLTACGFGDMPEDGGFFSNASDDAVESVDALDGLEPLDVFDAIQDIVERDEK